MKLRIITISSIILLGLVFTGCRKQDAGTNTGLSPAPDRNATAKQAPTATQELIRDWTEWVFTRDVSLAPWDDATGAKQYAAQPYTSGIMMLAGGGSPTLENRALTISLAQYQHVFIPLVNGMIYWNDCYPGNPVNNVPTGALNAIITESLNGPRTVILKWDGVSLLPEKLKDLRENSGFWVAPVHSSWDGGCVATSITFYADGFWAKVPLSLGVHTLEVAGDADYRRFKAPFSNHVIYTITVTN
jgi:hypothetical protein